MTKYTVTMFYFCGIHQHDHRGATLTLKAAGGTQHLGEGKLCVMLQLVAEEFLSWV